MFPELPISATDIMEPEGSHIKWATRTKPIQTGEETTTTYESQGMLVLLLLNIQHKKFNGSFQVVALNGTNKI